MNNLVKKDKFLFIHVQTPIAAVLGRIVAFKNHVPVVYTAHGFHFSKKGPLKNWLIFPIEWILSFNTEQLLLINKEDFILAKKFFHAKNINYIPGVGVNLTLLESNSAESHKLYKQKLLARNALSQNTKVLVSVGELSKRKNHSVVIKAIGLLGDKNIHFFIAGKGSERKSLQLLALRLGVSDQIHFLNYVTDIRQLNQAADLAILPSLREGLSRAGLEAIRDGAYLIGSDIRGIKDYIINDNIGMVFNPKDEVELSKLIHKKLNHSQTILYRTEISKLMMFDRENIDFRMKDIYINMGERDAN